jgi:hypothetical protein
VLDGRLTINGMDTDGQPIHRTVVFQDGEILESILRIKGKIRHHIAYGKFETEMTENGREVTHFHKGSGKGKHGLSRRWESLFGSKGVINSWYKRGRLIRQRFFYANGVKAYEYRERSTKPMIVRDAKGKQKYEVMGWLDGRESAYWGGQSVFHKPMENWFRHGKPFYVKDHLGRLIYKGEVQNQQQVGEWVVDGVTCHYLHGVPVPKSLFDTPVEELSIERVLRIENAQLRMAMMSRFNTEAIAKAGKVIHQEKDRQGNDMKLYDIKGVDTRVLQVICPTTKSHYFLRVPRDSHKCEEARQWTFGVGDGLTKEIHFEVET